METQAITVDRAEAKRLYREYKKHRHWSEPIDAEIQRAYQLIAQGRLVIRALESIRTAGFNEQGLPKLAICRADAKMCRLEPLTGAWLPERRLYERRGFRFIDSRAPGWSSRRRKGTAFDVLWSGMAPGPARGHEGIVPLVPVNLRPQRGLANYHILWEAEWTRTVPVDPLLLRQIGDGDMWVVVAAWDLTPVEQAALQARLSS
ncbi:MAG TPA: hypothetical protein VEA35_00645 [Ramlibacter sp.]|nr:hypothetical protein [Ramlibacter sp.]